MQSNNFHPTSIAETDSTIPTASVICSPTVTIARTINQAPESADYTRNFLHAMRLSSSTSDSESDISNVHDENSLSDCFDYDNDTDSEDATVTRITSGLTFKSNRRVFMSRTFPVTTPVLLFTIIMTAFVSSFFIPQTSSTIHALSQTMVLDLGIVPNWTVAHNMSPTEISDPDSFHYPYDSDVTLPKETLELLLPSSDIAHESQVTTQTDKSDFDHAPTSDIAHDSKELGERTAFRDHPEAGDGGKLWQQENQSLVIVDSELMLNFASFARGARPLTQLVSSTFKVSFWGHIRNFLNDLFGLRSYASLPPETALQTTLETGRCWAFPGSSGFIGVVLAQPIIITHVGYDHIAKVFDRDPMSAPRSLSIFGLLHIDDDYKVPESLRINHTLGSNRNYKNTAVFLTDIKYDIDGPSRMQTFSVIKKVIDLQIKFEAVLFQIHDNWGSDTFTCLYRVRVHGNT